MNSNMTEIRIESIASTASYIGEDGLILECAESQLKAASPDSKLFYSMFGGDRQQREGVRLVLSKPAALKLCGELWLYLQKVGVAKLDI